MDIFQLRSMPGFVRRCRQSHVGSTGQHALPFAGARRRRRVCLTRIEHLARPLARYFGRGNDSHRRPPSSAAAAAPVTPDSGAGSTGGAETMRNKPPPPSPSPQAAQPQACKDQPSRRKPRFRLVPEDPDVPVDRQLPEDNPSLDEIILDEQYYREMGLTPEDVQEALSQLDATELDPEGENLGLGDLRIGAQSASPAPTGVTNRQSRFPDERRTTQKAADGRFLQQQQQQQQQHPSLGSVVVEGAEDLSDTEEVYREYVEGEEEEEGSASQDEADQEGARLISPLGWDPQAPSDAEAVEELYGPEAVVLAGFRAEEHGVVRALLDSAGGHVIKVLPVTQAMLYGTVDEAIHMPEQDWAAPRPEEGPRGGGWGAQRSVLFSGLSLHAQLTVLELLESSGLSAVCAAAATQDLAGRRLGEVLAEAVASQRGQANRLPKEEEPWRAAAAATGRVADVRLGLTPLEDLIGDKARERLRLHDDDDQLRPRGADEAEDGAAAGSAGLSSFGLKAAEAAAAEWEAWRASRAAATGPRLDWGRDMEGGEGAGAGTIPGRSGDRDLGLNADSVAAPNLKDLGVDLEQLREQVLRQLSELDAETLDELLMDSPYGDAAGEALAQWQRAQAADGSGRSGLAAAAGTGMTGDDVVQLAERQWRRWQDAQASLETAAAAAGQLVVQAESSLVKEPPPLPPPPPSPQLPRREQQSVPSAAGAGAPVAADAPPAATQTTTAAAAATISETATEQPLPPKQRRQQSSSTSTASSPPAPAGHVGPKAPQPAPPSLPSFELFGGESSSFSELDDLLGRLMASGSADDDDASGLTAVLPGAAPMPPKLFETAQPGAGVSSSGYLRGSAAGSAGAVASISGGGGVLRQVQEAARSGIAPEEIQRMLDKQYGAAPRLPGGQIEAPSAPPPPPPSAAAGAGARTSQRRRGSLFTDLRSSNVTAPPPAAPGAAARAEDGAARQRPRRSYGPSPPPEPDPVMKPLLELRPDIAKAVQDKKVQFVDLSRLSEKQKRQFVEHQARQRLLQQAQQQEQQLQQQQRLQSLQSSVRTAAGAAGGPQGANGQEEYGQREYGKVYDGDQDVDAEKSEEDPAEESEEDEDEEEDAEDDDEEGGGTALDAEKLALLVEASKQEGVSLEDTLAQAVVMGVRLPEEVLREASVSSPSEAALARAREEYDRLFREWAAAEGMSVDAQPGVEVGNDPSLVEGGNGVDDPDDEEQKQQQQQQNGRTIGAPAEAMASGRPGTRSSSSRSSSSSSSNGGSRPWGAGLMAPRRRRPAQPPPS